MAIWGLVRRCRRDAFGWGGEGDVGGDGPEGEPGAADRRVRFTEGGIA